VQRGDQHVGRQPQEVRLLRVVQKTLRRQRPMDRVVGADEGLGTNQAPCPQVDFRLVPELQPVALEDLIQCEPLAGQKVAPQAELLDYLLDRLLAKRFEQHGQHAQALARPAAPEILRQGRVEAGHELDRALDARGSERADRGRSVGGTDAEIQEDRIRLRAQGRRDHVACVLEPLNAKAELRDHGRNGAPGGGIRISHETQRPLDGGRPQSAGVAALR